MQVGLEERGSRHDGVDLAAEDAVEELVRGRGEERRVAKRGGDARLDLGVVRDDGRVEPAGCGVDPREELGVERGADAAECGIHRACVPLRLVLERGIDRVADRVRHVCGEGVHLGRDAVLEWPDGDKLDADEEDAEDAHDEASQ